MDLIKGREAIDEYRNASPKHPYKKLMLDLKKAGFNSIDDFFNIDNEAKDVAFKQQGLSYLKKTKLKCEELFPNSAEEFVKSFETVLPDTILFAHTPRMVYVGASCLMTDNINIVNCKKENVGVARGKLDGRAYVYDKGDAIYIILSTLESISVKLLEKIVQKTLTNMGIGTFIEFNDIRYGNSRVAMSAPSVKIGEHYITGIEVLFKSNTNLAEKCLFFPGSKWVNKPVTNIKEWIRPLNTIKPIKIKDFIVEFMKVVKQEWQNGN